MYTELRIVGEMASMLVEASLMVRIHILRLHNSVWGVQMRLEAEISRLEATSKARGNK